MGITAEYFVYAEDSIIDSLCLILNKLFESGQVTDSMKIGLINYLKRREATLTLKI